MSDRLLKDKFFSWRPERALAPQVVNSVKGLNRGPQKFHQDKFLFSESCVRPQCGVAFQGDLDFGTTRSRAENKSKRNVLKV